MTDLAKLIAYNPPCVREGQMDQQTIKHIASILDRIESIEWTRKYKFREPHDDKAGTRDGINDILGSIRPDDRVSIRKAMLDAYEKWAELRVAELKEELCSLGVEP